MVELKEVEVKTEIDVIETPTATLIDETTTTTLEEDDGDSEYEDESDSEAAVVVERSTTLISSGYSDIDDEFNDDEDLEESLLERLQALVDVVPRETRKSVARSVSTFTSGAWGAVQWVGSAAWVVATAAMLVGLPVALELEREQFVFQQEAQMRQQQQQAQQMVQPGLGGIPGTIPGGNQQIPGLPNQQI